MTPVKIVIFHDSGLRFEVDLDDDTTLQSPSIYLFSPAAEIRQFCTVAQLEALRDQLNKLLPIKTVEVTLTNI